MTYEQQTLPGITSATSSEASAAGPTPSDSRECLTTSRSGRRVAPASPTAVPASSSATPTRATSGQSLCGSSASAALSESVANKCRQLLATAGSTGSPATWKAKATPSGRVYWAHTPSARRTGASGSTGALSWGTPRVTTNGGTPCPEHTGKGSRLEDQAVMAWGSPSSRDWKDTPGMATEGTNPDGSTRTRLDQLPRQAALAWPTPRSEDSEQTGAHRGNADTMTSAAAMATWPTPQVAQGPNMSENRGTDYGGARARITPQSVEALVFGPPPSPSPVATASFDSCRRESTRSCDVWPSPMAGSPATETYNAAGNTDSSRKTVAIAPSTGVLNPAFARWLMGYPRQWCEAAIRAHRKMRTQRRRRA